MSKRHVQVGDVFRVPIDDETWSYGQVVASFGGSAFYLALFKRRYREPMEPAIDDIVSESVVLLGLSFDAKIAAGDWPVIGCADVRPDIPLPAYKESTGAAGSMLVVDYSGSRERPATPSEAAVLRFRTFVAPVRLEMALRAKHGLAPWKEAYANLEPDLAMTSSHLFGTGH